MYRLTRDITANVMQDAVQEACRWEVHSALEGIVQLTTRDPTYSTIQLTIGDILDTTFADNLDEL